MATKTTQRSPRKTAAKPAAKSAPPRGAAPAAPAPATLALWNRLETTDPAATKQFNKKGFKGTAVNPCYVAKKLTEEFGPCGLGWRLVVEDEQYVPGHFYDEVNRAVIHVIRGHLEYRKAEGEWISTGPQFGQTTFVGHDKNGFFTDEEAPKKSISDCLSKCAVQLGLSADIHLGMWDGNKYTNEGGAGAPAAQRKPRQATAATAAPAPRIASPVWADIERTQTPADLLTVFNKAASSPRLYDDPATWEEVCNGVAEAFRRINQPNDPASGELLAGLQAERERLDNAA